LNYRGSSHGGQVYPLSLPAACLTVGRAGRLHGLFHKKLISFILIIFTTKTAKIKGFDLTKASFAFILKTDL